MADVREQRLIEAFVELADTLVSDFDVIEFLHHLTQRATELLDVAEAGLLLGDVTRTLHLMASSSERARALELFQLQSQEGPCLDCYRTGVPVLVESLDDAAERWPRFVDEARMAGFAAVHALPLRLRRELIGVLGLFGAAPGRLNEADLAAGQGMADIATIGLLQQRAIHESHLTVDQLQFALNSRIVIEQAKGVLAERDGIDMDEAFRRLRRHARDHNQRLGEVAHGVIGGSVHIGPGVTSKEGRPGASAQAGGDG